MWLADLFARRREDVFFALLQQHAALLATAAQTLRRYTAEGTPALSDEVDKVEKEADGVLAQLVAALRDSFVTPLDRQDIYNLGEAIDDMIDYLNNAAREIKLFGVTATPEMTAIVDTLVEAASAIERAVRCLNSNPSEAYEQSLAASRAENVVEQRYREALAKLFESSDIARVFKLREIYRHLSNSADRAEAVGKLICKIVVKTT